MIKDKFTVSFYVGAVYDVEVEAETLEDAIKIAEVRFSEADFGEAKEVDGDIAYIFDENWNEIDWR